MLDYSANDGRWGAATSRNLALARATGAYFMTVDGDDVLLPGALSALVGSLEDAPAAA